MRQELLYGRALHLEYFTVGYNILEALASIFFGSVAGSIALVGFGLDSIVRVSKPVAILAPMFAPKTATSKIGAQDPICAYPGNTAMPSETSRNRENGVCSQPKAGSAWGQG